MAKKSAGCFLGWRVAEEGGVMFAACAWGSRIIVTVSLLCSLLEERDVHRPTTVSPAERLLVLYGIL